MKNNKIALTVMAAGMGSRFGGLKQIAPITDDGRSILDFSVQDALNSGFNKVVFIIKKEIEADFRNAVGKKFENKTDVSYAFQSMEACIPSAYSSLIEFRKKPWGTGHAILCAKEALGNTPFAVINADDYYGKNSYNQLYAHLTHENTFCMCGFQLGNTLTENGTVSRGICEDENGFLRSVTEHTALDKNSGIPLNTLVSMNMWGLNSKIFDYLEQDFAAFLQNIQVPEKEEFFLPSVINKAIQTHNEQVKILPTTDKWYGITYKEDAEFVKQAFKEMLAKGEYNAN